MGVIVANKAWPIKIGKQEENNVTKIRFDETKDWIKEFPDGYIAIVHHRPNDDVGLPVGKVDVIDGVTFWTIQNSDLVNSGEGEAEVILKQGEFVKKSSTYKTEITKAVIAGEITPEPYEGFMETLLGAAEEIKDIYDGTNGILFRALEYSHMRKISDYLFECWYDNINYGLANDYYKRTGYFPTGGCSGLGAKSSNGSYLGRNFDWFYNHEAEFIIHVPAITVSPDGVNTQTVRHASIGTSSGNTITEQNADAMKPDEFYSILPFVILDGVNDAGVMASCNVVPKYEETGKKNTVVQPLLSSKIELNAGMIIRYIMDNFDNATDAVEFIRDYATIVFPKRIIDMGFELHFLVKDNDNNYILEFENNHTVIINCNDMPAPIMTNFHINHVVYNGSGNPLYTPFTQDASHNAMITNNIEAYGSGLERFNTIYNGYLNLGDSFNDEDISNIMKSVFFTKAYPSSSSPASPPWYTEMVGHDLNCASEPSDFAEIMVRESQDFLNRNRDTGTTWQTCHSSTYIYSPEFKGVKVYSQENTNNHYEFYLHSQTSY